MTSHLKKRRLTDSWRTVWKTPLGAFIILVVVSLTALTGSLVYFYDSVHDRRQAFCEAENLQSVRARQLWEGVIVQSEANRKGFVVGSQGRKFPVEFSRNDPKRIAAFRELVKKTYPVNDC